jgi:hypothetical protein
MRDELVSLIELRLANPPEKHPILVEKGLVDMQLLLARFAMEAGETERVDGMIAAAQEKLASCRWPDCNPAELFNLLLVRGRLADAPSFVTGEMAQRLETTPTFLFDFELREGKGVPATLDWLVAQSLRQGHVSLALMSIQQCATQRATPFRRIYQKLQFDFDAARVCARTAIEVSRTPTSIEDTARRLADGLGSMTPAGRPSAANTAMELAATTQRERPDISQEMEQAALDLWREGPPVAMDIPALFAMRRLAEARLRAEGRL